MAGHSKWAQIKRAKAVKDTKKGAAFAQCSREIMMAAKLGGGDPEANFRLRTAILHAKTVGMPADTIKRAIEKGSGVGNADQMEALNYEGYGPGGVAVFIETLTDNRNRTAGDIRSYFNKYNGNLGTDGSVAWIFEEKGIVRLEPAAGLNEEDAFEKALAVGASEFLTVEDDDTGELLFEVQTAPLDLNEVCQALTAAGVGIRSAVVTRLPQNSVYVDSEEVAKPLLKLMDALQSQEDVREVYANFELDEALLAKME